MPLPENKRHGCGNKNIKVCVSHRQYIISGTMKTTLPLLTALVCLEWHFANGHGYMTNPWPRQALFLDPLFAPYQPEFWNYGQLWCGNDPQGPEFETCGRCGDDPGNTTFNQGGPFGNNHITANYSSGSLIEIQSNFWYAHAGYIEIDLCPQFEETDECFQKLEIVGGSCVFGRYYCIFDESKKMCVEYDGESWRSSLLVQLPHGIRCERCTLRWNYRSSTNYSDPDRDSCYSPRPVQSYRNCADIQIL